MNRPFDDKLNICNTKQNETCAEMQYKIRNCLHVDFSIHQCIQNDFISGMPQLPVKILDQERTHYLIQNEEQENSVNLWSIIKIMTIIKILQKVLGEVPQFRSRGLFAELLHMHIVHGEGCR